MSKDDSVVSALLQFLVIQQKDILHMRAHLMAMEQVLVSQFGPEVGRRFYADAEKLQNSDVFGGTQAAIRAIEELRLQVMPEHQQ